RKAITAAALAGDRLILWDNITGKFGNGTLDRVLTTTAWKDRILGLNKIVDAPLYVTWYGTGNNVVPSGDTPRRICHIRLESNLEKPELGDDFRRPNLLAYVRANRMELLGAALTILRAYCVAGRPDMKLPAWGSFEGWSALVRNAIVWVGLPDPGETRFLLDQRADHVAQNMRTLLNGWERMDPKGEGLTAAQVFDRLV